MNKNDKNSQRQIEVLKAQLTSKNKIERKINNVQSVVDTSVYKKIDIDPKFYKRSLIKTINLTLVILSTLLILYVFQDKWVGLINLGF